MMQASRGISSYFIAAILMLMNMQMSSAVQHVVGDDRGWDPLSDITGWNSRNIFRVGDNLWFAYSSAQQSVMELRSAEAYERCDGSNPIKVYNGGLDAVPLVEEGIRYFTSGRLEDCQRGMKLRVNVISDVLDNNSSDNFHGVSDGLHNVGSNLDLISDGMEKVGDDYADIVSDGVKKTANFFDILISWLPSSWFSSSWFSYLSSPSSLWVIKFKSESATSSSSSANVGMKAAEGPTSGSFGYLSHSWRIILSSCCCLVTIIIYYSIA